MAMVKVQSVDREASFLLDSDMNAHRRVAWVFNDEFAR